MQKMGKTSKALGFAVYLDLLEQLEEPGDGYDVDVLLTYDDSVDVSKVSAKASALTDSGKSVLVVKFAPETLKCREKIVMTEGGTAK